MIKSTKTVSALALATTMALPMSGGVQASSHREAPFITSMPKVDATDLYTFRSYEPNRQDFVTIIANYYPLQDPGGGPNFFMMDPNALYEIHIDNNGDAKEDMSFQFRFKNDLAGGTGVALDIGPPAMKVEIPLINAGETVGADRSKLNVKETYTVKLARNGRRTANPADVVNVTGDAKEFVKPMDYIGQKSFPNYAEYAKAHQYDIKIPGCEIAAKPAQGRMFVGQRKEGFAVNVGVIFDLINAPAAVVTGTMGRGAPNKGNPLEGKNVTTLALELPIACVLAGAQKTIGSWTTASVRQARVLDPKPTFARPALEGGAWTQVSRLSMPLVNEVIIGLKDKNLFNASEPSGDGQFLRYVTHPTLAALINSLFMPAKAPTTPRDDLVAAFLTGVEGVNKNGSTAEMQRLNLSLPVTLIEAQNNLGALGCFKPGSAVVDTALPTCDPAGFPNGRRPGDDTVDIELRVMMGALLPADKAPAGAVPFTDGVLQDDSDFDNAFPYLKTPLPGAITAPM